MKLYTLLFILFIPAIIGNKLYAQRETDFGFSGGAAYYMGDINPSIPFYSPKINLGAVYRYNLNPRYVLKAEANYMRLAGSDADFNNTFQNSRKAKFSLAITEFTGQFEFNFLPLKFKEKQYCFTPFVSAGLGYTFGLSQVVVPFALGVKVSYGLNWTVGLGWNFRKTFTDKIDGINNGVYKGEDLMGDNNRSILNNNDWYSFANIFITYKIFDFRSECPAYMKTY